MIFFLKLIGSLNAAVWFGGNVAITYVAFKGLFSKEMKALLQHEFYPGAVGQIIFQYFFFLQLFCGIIALIHLAAENFYLGRRMPRIALLIVIATLSLSAFNGLITQPKLKELHWAKYQGATLEARQDAKSKLGRWHATAQLANLLVIVGTGTYFFLIVYRWDSSRFPSVAKFAVDKSPLSRKL